MICEDEQSANDSDLILQSHLEFFSLGLTRILPTCCDLESRKQCSRRVFFVVVESPGRKDNATESQSEQEEVEARPKDTLRDQRCSDDGRNGAANAIATMGSTQNCTGRLDVRAKDVVQRQAGCCSVSDEEEAVQVSTAQPQSKDDDLRYDDYRERRRADKHDISSDQEDFSIDQGLCPSELGQCPCDQRGGENETCSVANEDKRHDCMGVVVVCLHVWNERTNDWWKLVSSRLGVSYRARLTGVIQSIAKVDNTAAQNPPLVH